MTTSPTSLNSTESRALSLLGQGLGPEVVASALGVSASRISQLLSDPNFAAEVASLRYQTLSKHNERDSKYDSIEDTLLDRMKDLIPLMYKPFEILKAISVINAAKRRGSSAPQNIGSQAAVVSLVMPTQIVNIFGAANTSLTVNTQNQVVKAGTQDLVTVQSGRMNSLLASHKTSQTSQGDPNVIENLPTQT